MMANFLVWSDLHNEFWRDIPEIPSEAMDVDALLLAGDVSTQGRHVDVALLLWDVLRKPVVMIRGNHEFYDAKIDEVIADDTARIAEINKKGGDIRMLDGTSTEVAGTRIVGATLWTDLDLFPGSSMAARAAVKNSMNDFWEIRKPDGKFLDIEEWIDMHWKDRKAISDILETPFDGPTTVMTHHAPLRAMLHKNYDRPNTRDDLGNAGFASDLGEEMQNFHFDQWISGHSHEAMHVRVRSASGPAEVMSNPRGYPFEKKAFDSGFILDTEPYASPEPC
jgi:hypothetical protein